MWIFFHQWFFLTICEAVDHQSLPWKELIFCVLSLCTFIPWNKNSFLLCMTSHLCCYNDCKFLSERLIHFFWLMVVWGTTQKFSKYICWKKKVDSPKSNHYCCIWNSCLGSTYSMNSTLLSWTELLKSFCISVIGTSCSLAWIPPLSEIFAPSTWFSS